MDRLERSGGGTRTITFASNGVPLDTDANAAVPVTIYNSAGDQHTTKSATRVSAGVYSYTLTAANTAILDTYREVWTPTFSGDQKTQTKYYEVVGGFYFSIAELREFDAALTLAAYSDQKVINAREKAEGFIENVTKKSWAPRGARETLNGTGKSDLALPYEHIPIRSLVSLSVTSGTTVDTFDATELADVSISATGYLTRKTLGYWTSGYRNVSAFYEYGEDQPPEDVKEAAMLLAQARLIPGANQANQAGVKQLSVEGYSLTYRDGLISSVPGVHDLLEPYTQNYVAIA